MSNNIKAIETYHNGYHFRSRLEARWAVWMDSLIVPYYYEHQGFVIDGVPYLPDFWLPQHELWLEIKPTEPTSREIFLAEGMQRKEGHKCIIFSGNCGANEFLVHELMHECGDWRWERGPLMACRGCRGWWRGYGPNGDDGCGTVGKHQCGDFFKYPTDHSFDPAMTRAFDAARSARFGLKLSEGQMLAAETELEKELEA